MEFLYPSFLLGLLAVSIPILIHLFNFRRFKKIAFTNVRFLKEVKLETRSRSRLKHLLVLISRILAICFLVFAFARPFIPRENTRAVVGDKLISVYVDNSFSMEAENENGLLLEQAKNRAMDISSAFSPTDRFQLITNDFEGRQQRFQSREEFNNMVQDIQVSPAARKISEVFTRQRDLLNSESGSKTAFLLSDFQNSLSNFEEANADTGIATVLIPIQSPTADNLYIDSVWFRTPVRQINQNEELSVRIVNSGKQDVENVPLKLSVNGVQKAIGTFSAAAGSEADTTLFYTNTETGIQQAVLSLNDDPVIFDDRFYFSYPVAEEVRVLNIRSNVNSQSRDYFKSIFGDDPFYRYIVSEEGNIDYARLSENNFIILDELFEIPSGMARELKGFVENGGSIFILPAPEIETASYNNFYNSIALPVISGVSENSVKVSEINLDHPLYQNIFENIPRNMDLPKTDRHYRFSRNINSGEQQLLTLQNGDAFLSVFPRKSGFIYNSAVSLNTEKNDFARHAVFVASVLRMAEFSLNDQALQRTIGENIPFAVKNIKTTGDQVFHLISEENSIDIIPEVQNVQGVTEVYSGNYINQAGNYLLSLNDEPVLGIGFNYNRNESDLRTMSTEDLRQSLNNSGFSRAEILDNSSPTFSQSIKVLDEGKQLWKICLLIALLFIAVEVLLLRFWKT